MKGLLAREAGHDPALQRRRHDVGGHRARGRPVQGARPAHHREGRLHRRAHRFRGRARAQVHQAASSASSRRRASSRTGTSSRSAATTVSRRVRSSRPRSSAPARSWTSPSTSKGKGFQGLIKRHKFSRGPESHGSMNVRQPGAIGATDAARVFKGVRMSGQMGNVRTTARAYKVVRVDAERNLLLLKGGVPGAQGRARARPPVDQAA